MNLQPKGLSAIVHRSIGAAPTGDRGKSIGHALARDGPKVQHHRLSYRVPGNVPGRNRALRSSDIFADGEVEVMTGQTQPRVAFSMPELREAGINIDVSFATETAQERFGSQVAANVHQEIGTVRPFKQAFIG